ncbi:hypothetical protein VTN00DRAFT_2062 [Thermoascus crustaceus]|uniref:uncharacterized protein n=1 Tax=Thermoascus crustaceus TaxID=5088 RepID=UPI003743CBC2
MFRPASSRALLRAAAPGRIRVVQARRLASTAPPEQKSRSWKSTLLRLGLAVGAVYYYNTSSIFAEQPELSLRPQPEEDEANLPTLDSISSKIRQRQQQKQQEQQPATQQQQQQQTDAQSAVAVPAGTAVEERPEGPSSSPQDLEAQADQEGAFNPETGEINWDCPCLGGMAHGPCGEEFKAAFSCFVFSKEEPKGMDCIDKFKGMQDCFRQHPDVYGAELDDDEELDEQAAASSPSDDKQLSPAAQADVSSRPEEKHAEAKQVRAQIKAEHAQQGEQSESEALVPKAAHDAAEKRETKATKTEK